MVIEIGSTPGKSGYRKLGNQELRNYFRVADIRPRNAFGMEEGLTVPNLLLKAETYPRWHRVV